MTDIEKNSPYYQSQAKEIVDELFEKRVFNEKLTRDDLQSIEDLIWFYFESQANIARKWALLTLSLKRNAPKSN